MPDTATASDRPSPRGGGLPVSASIDDALYRTWLSAKSSADHWTRALKEVEAVIRDQTGGALVITVDGAPVARRVIREAKNVTWTSDYYRRLGGRDGDDA